uniref:NADH-ubiquinone oxidoreductase chain 6 n=1 Tax=Platypeza sp. XL-2018 TaxID=2321083 RepID=A0A5H2PJ63_9MUSC|nr:NADH dehydrogenase subunit 6 [Platypeza sp. XL-2018]
MIQSMLYSFIIISSITFMKMSHPLAMGLMLLIQTVLICLVSGLLSKSFWFSYILFLVFMGGMLVLFIYVTSLSSNEMFSLSMKMTLYMLILFISLSLIFYISEINLYSKIVNNDMIEMTNMSSYLPDNKLNLIKLYNYPTNFITVLLINYLLITLIVIVKITNLFYGPLRRMN